VKGLDLEFKYGLMGQNTKVNGKETKLMEKENFGI